MGYLLNLAKRTEAPAESASDDAAGPPEREIRSLLARLFGEDHPDYAQAVAIAMGDPGAALTCLRMTATTGTKPGEIAELHRLAIRWHQLAWPDRAATDETLRALHRISPANVARELQEFRAMVGKLEGRL